jgi:hypothetical protein
MNPATAANAIVTLAAVIALVCLLYGPWQTLCTDLSRQVIFERRDRLFNLALDGRIDFNSEGYRAARQVLNGYLRFAHEMTWVDFLISAYFIQIRRRQPPRWHDTLQTLPADVRGEINELVRECSAVLTAMMALKSMLLGPICGLIAIGLVCTSGLSWLLRRVARQEKFDRVNDTIQAAVDEYAENEMALA